MQHILKIDVSEKATLCKESLEFRTSARLFHFYFLFSKGIQINSIVYLFVSQRPPPPIGPFREPFSLQNGIKGNDGNCEIPFYLNRPIRREYFIIKRSVVGALLSLVISNQELLFEAISVIVPGYI